MKGTRCSPLWILPSSLWFLSASGSYCCLLRKMTPMFCPEKVARSYTNAGRCSTPSRRLVTRASGSPTTLK
jgi:hypothetical protein